MTYWLFKIFLSRLLIELITIFNFWLFPGIISHSGALRGVGWKPPQPYSGTYCHARAKLPEAVLRRLVYAVGDELESRVPADWLWHGRHVKIPDGTTLLTPDTPANQEAWPQSRCAKTRPGLSALADAGADLLGDRRRLRRGGGALPRQGDGRDGPAAFALGSFPARRYLLGRLLLLFLLHAGFALGRRRRYGEPPTSAAAHRFSPRPAVEPRRPRGHLAASEATAVDGRGNLRPNARDAGSAGSESGSRRSRLSRQAVGRR